MSAWALSNRQAFHLQAKQIQTVVRPLIDSDFESDSGKDLFRVSLHEGNLGNGFGTGRNIDSHCPSCHGYASV